MLAQDDDKFELLAMLKPVLEFRALIETERLEAPLQKFLEAHPDILADTFDSNSYYPTVFPKFRLGGDFIPDFVMIGHRSSWTWTVNLIEIEPSVLERPLFNKSGQSAGRLRDAEGQVKKWKMWMKDYQDSVFVPYALKKLKERGAWDGEPRFYNLSEGTRQSMMHVRYRIIIGSREYFDERGNQYRNLEYDQHVEIVPWDRLLEKFEYRLNKSVG